MRLAINIEAVFAVLVIIASSCRTAFPPSAEPRDANNRRYLLVLLVLPAAFLWTLPFPFVSDDFAHIIAALHFNFGNILKLFTVPAGDLFFRPLGYISYAIDARWAGHSVVLWHLSTLLIHFVNSLLVYLVARQKHLSRFFAVTAALIFGIHGSRPEAVTWMACRFDLIATFFVLLTLSSFLASPRRPLLYAASLLTALLALISKEVAYVLPVLLLLIAEPKRWRDTIRRVVPFAILTAAVFAYRWHVLSGIGGYQTASNTPTILNFSLLRTLNALFLRLWATLFFPVNWTESPQWWLWTALFLGIAAYVAIAFRGARSGRALSFLLFTFIASLPAQHLLLIGADLEKSRILYLSSVGFALFLGVVLETLRKPEWRIPAALAIICFQTACLEHNLITWRGVALEARQTCDSVAAYLQGNSRTASVLDLPNALRGVYFLHTGMPQCLEFRYGIDVERIRPDHADLTLHWDDKSETVKP